MDEKLNSVDAEQVVSVEPQTTEEGQTQETLLTDTSEADSQSNEKSEQSKEENAAWKQMRLDKEAAEAKATKAESDREIAKTYGPEYGVFSEEDIADKFGHLGISNAEQLKVAIEKEAQEAEMRERGIDPEALAKEVEEHPDVKEARENKARAKNYGEFEQFYLENVGKVPDLKDLPQSVIDAFNNGESMKVAFMEYDYKNLRTKAMAQETNTKNAESSTGSVTGNGNSNDGYFTAEQVKAMSPAQVKYHFNAIEESMKKWN